MSCSGNLSESQGQNVVGRLLELTHDHPWVAGWAIDALGALHREADKVVPRLVELFDEFEEFDPDHAYAGQHARVCQALELFAGAAGFAVPRLVRYMEEWLEKAAEDRTDSQAVVRTLKAIGRDRPEVKSILNRMEEDLTR